MTSLIFAALLSTASAGTTQAEARQSSTELAANYVDIRDDRSDLASLESIISRWDTARYRNSYGAEMSADQALESWIRREIAEGYRELSEARSEVNASERELRQESRDYRSSPSRYERDQVADDARDLQDDRQDLATMEADLKTLQRIADQLSAMQSRFDRGRASAADYRTKRSLMTQLENLARKETRLNQVELSEDLAERRESRWD